MIEMEIAKRVNVPYLAGSLTARRRECVTVNTGERADGGEYNDVGNTSRPCRHTPLRRVTERLMVPLYHLCSSAVMNPYTDLFVVLRVM